MIDLDERLAALFEQYEENQLRPPGRSVTEMTKTLIGEIVEGCLPPEQVMSDGSRYYDERRWWNYCLDDMRVNLEALGLPQNGSGATKNPNPDRRQNASGDRNE